MNNNYKKIYKNLNKSLQPIGAADFESSRLDFSYASVAET